MDPKRIVREIQWLKDNPHFEERPASILEFLGPDYLGIEGKVRPGIKEALIAIFGEEPGAKRIASVERAMVTGGVGIGKTTFASIALPYMAHWTLCLKDPQEFFELLPGSRIAFMQMSTSEDQAAEVVFGDIFARIKHSKWFLENYPHDPKFSKQIRFPKEIWVLPGDSAETTFEGYNILAGILDEADSHKVTKDKDYADQGYETIHSRIASRFIDSETNGHKGLLIVIGQMKKGNGFAAKKFEELSKDPRAHVVRMSIWESLGWHRFLKPDGTRDSFWYDSRRKQIIPDAIAAVVSNKDLIEIPNAYLANFKNKPEKALKDLAGIPPATNDPFISLTDKIDICTIKWKERFNGVGGESPVDENPTRPQFKPWFKANNDPRKRALHLDIAYSSEGDAAAIAMGHVAEVVEIDDEKKPYIVIDCLIRIKAQPGTEIMISDLRRYIYDLRYELKFRIKNVTMDGFQCFTGDTRVPLLDGRTLTMKELAKQYPDGGVYTYSWDGERIVPGKIKRAWRTATKSVITVTLDNGEMIRCTPDHRFMLRDGSYKEARNLKAADSLMPLYRRVTPENWNGLRGYEQVHQPRDGNRGGRKWQFTHRMAIDDAVPRGHLIYHLDHNKRNNSPENLVVWEERRHREHHNKVGTANFKAMWADETLRTKTVAAVSTSNRASTGRSAKRYRHDVTFDEILSSWLYLGRPGWRKVAKFLEIDQTVVYGRLKEEGYASWVDFKVAHGGESKRNYFNHRVLSVVDHLETEDVYDLEIEEHHNFALEAGVFVHNSTDTQQQLRKRKFTVDYLSVDRSTLPYEDLREAIYEERIEFPEYMTYLNKGDTELVNIAVKELMELQDTGKKIDHPQGGSKDVADALAGVCSTLMGDRQYRKGVVNLGEYRERKEEQATGTSGQSFGVGIPAFPLTGSMGQKAPIPPAAGASTGLTIPRRLQPRG